MLKVCFNFSPRFVNLKASECLKMLPATSRRLRFYYRMCFNRRSPFGKQTGKESVPRLNHRPSFPSFLGSPVKLSMQVNWRRKVRTKQVVRSQQIFVMIACFIISGSFVWKFKRASCSIVRKAEFTDMSLTGSASMLPVL